MFMIRLNQAFILVIALASGLSSESWAAEDGQTQVIDVQNPSQAFVGSISEKSDHDLNTLLATKWDDLDVHQRGAILTEVKLRMARHKGPVTKSIKLQTHHRYGERIIRQSDGSVLRIKTRVLRVQPVISNPRPYGVGYEERAKKQELDKKTINSSVRDVSDSRP